MRRTSMSCVQATRVNAAEMTGSLPPRVQRILNAGLFTPRVGRLAAAQRFVMPPALHDVHPPQVSPAAHGWMPKQACSLPVLQDWVCPFVFQVPR
jgi:hypothetical protein